MLLKGNNSKIIDHFQANYDLISSLYPGWTMRLYHNLGAGNGSATLDSTILELPRDGSLCFKAIYRTRFSQANLSLLLLHTAGEFRLW